MRMDKVQQMVDEIQVRIITGMKHKYPESFWDLTYQERVEVLGRLHSLNI